MQNGILTQLFMKKWKLGEQGGQRSHVACEEENEGKYWKMKKIKASLIKRLLRISTQAFVSLVLELSLFSLILLET